MKKILILFIAIISFSSCDENENTIYDNINGQTGIGFVEDNKSVIVPAEGTSIELAVQVTTLTTNDRTYQVSIDNEASNLDSQNYSIGTITIPANSYDGALSISFSDVTLEELVAYKLVLNLEKPSEASFVGSETATIEVTKYLICNDIILTMNEDNYSSERDWEVTDLDGNVVIQASDFPDFPYADGGANTAIVKEFTLEDGCYIFTIYDSYGDGQYDGNTTGDYSLKCSIINHASGEGNWGSSESTEFCVNP